MEKISLERNKVVKIDKIDKKAIYCEGIIKRNFRLCQILVFEFWNSKTCFAMNRICNEHSVFCFWQMNHIWGRKGNVKIRSISMQSIIFCWYLAICQLTHKILLTNKNFAREILKMNFNGKLLFFAQKQDKLPICINREVQNSDASVKISKRKEFRSKKWSKIWSLKLIFSFKTLRINFNLTI